MSVTVERPPVHPWESRPGWGISVDLTPPEILDARHVRVLKRLIALGLVLVVVVATGVSLLALDDKSTAQGSYDAAQARTTELRAQAGAYAEVTILSAVTRDITAQVATLMTHDVDFVVLMRLVRAGLPPRVQLTSESIVLAPAEVAAATPAGTEPAIVGSISLAGTGDAIKDLAPFLATLNHLPGVVDVLPTSTIRTDTGMAFTLSMNITGDLYTHRYDGSGTP
jgi:hypothetical protein